MNIVEAPSAPVNTAINISFVCMIKAPSNNQLRCQIGIQLRCINSQV